MLITIKDMLLLIYSVNDSQTLQKAVGWKSWVDKVDESGHFTTKYDYGYVWYTLIRLSFTQNQLILFDHVYIH